MLGIVTFRKMLKNTEKAINMNKWALKVIEY